MKRTMINHCVKKVVVAPSFFPTHSFVFSENIKWNLNSEEKQLFVTTIEIDFSFTLVSRELAIKRISTCI